MTALVFYASVLGLFPASLLLRFPGPVFRGSSGRAPTWRGPWVRAGVYSVLLAFQLLQHVFATLTPAKVWPGLDVNVGSSLLFPFSLAILLFLYVTQRPGEFGRVCWLILGVNLLVAAAACVVRARKVDLGLPPAAAELWTHESVVVISLGTLLTLVDALLLVWCFRLIGGRTESDLSRVLLPLYAALLFDAVVFTFILHAVRGVEFGPVFVSQWASKWLVGAVYAACLHLYFRTACPGLDCWRAAPPGRYFGVTGWRAWARQHGLSVPVDTRRGEGMIAPDASVTFVQQSPTEGLMTGTLLKELPTPHAVREVVRRLAASDTGLSPHELAETEAHLKLSHLYGGRQVLCLGSGPDLRVLAVGTGEEVEQALAALPNDEAALAYVDFPPAWEPLRARTLPLVSAHDR